jgi:hypothetical protein
MANLKLLGSVSGYTELQAASTATPTVFTLPAEDGSAGQVLTTNGSGRLQFVTISTSTQATALLVDTTYRTTSTDLPGEGTPFTIPCRDMDGNLNAVLFQGVATSAQFADLAEKYVADALYEPGTVVEFGGEFEVTIATDETTRVAGVISLNPAFIMNTNLECSVTRGERTAIVALQGRVPTKVRGTIRKGDMLVSGGDGFARPTTNPKMGTIIGKALEDFEGTEGLIEVVVGRM